METEDLSLLVKSKPWFWGTKLHEIAVTHVYKRYSAEFLSKLWMEMYEEFKTLDPTNNNDKILNIHKKIDSLIFKYCAVRLSVKCLKLDRNEELINVLKKQKYKLSNETYKGDLDRIDNQSNSILMKVDRLKRQLPKKEENKSSIYDVIASYSLILGFNIYANKVTVKEFFALQKQVKIKLKQLEGNGRQGNNNR